MTRSLSLLLLAFLSTLATLSVDASTHKYAKAMVVFGDSVSDTGNCFKSQGAPDKDVYYKGRFCNGPIWVDILGQKVKHLEIKNYAFGGATACLDHKTYPGAAVNNSWIRTVPEQVDTFLSGKRRPQLPKNRFVVVWIGANDISFGFASGTIDGPVSALAYVTKTVNCIADQVTRLADAGEKNIIVFNLPPLEKTPLAQAANASIRDAIGPFVNVVNEALSARILALKLTLPDTELDIYNVHDSLLAGYADATKLGFKNAVDPCVVTASALIKNSEVYSTCYNANNRIWMDELHPTTNVHKKVIIKDFLPYLRDKKLVK